MHRLAVVILAIGCGGGAAGPAGSAQPPASDVDPPPPPPPPGFGTVTPAPETVARVDYETQGDPCDGGEVAPTGGHAVLGAGTAEGGSSTSTIGTGTRGTGTGTGTGTGRARGDRTQVTLGEAAGDHVHGNSADKEAIRRVVQSRLAQLRHCYEQELAAHPDLVARLVVQFTIATTGKVSAATARGGNAGLETCVAGVFRRMTFARPAGIMHITYPLVFDTAP